MPAGNPQAYIRQGMPKRKAFQLALSKMKSKNLGNMGRRVGRNLTPGIPRRVGRRMDFRDTNFNRGVAPGERPPGRVPDFDRIRKPRPLPIPGNEGPVPPNFPPGRPRPRPGGTLGVRRLRTLGDENRMNDKIGLAVAMRLFGRAQQGQGFGYKAFGERVGGNTEDFFEQLKPYLQGTGYGRMFRQAAGMPVRPHNVNKRRRRPKPMPLPEPEPEPTE